MTAKRPSKLKPEEKLKIVNEATSLSDEQLGAFLRSRGIHETHLEQWRLQMLGGLGKAEKKSKSNPTDTKRIKRIRELEKELNRKDKALAETAALLGLEKKSPGNLGGRGRQYSYNERKKIIELIDVAVASGARLKTAAEIIGLSSRTIIRWRKNSGGQDQRKGPLSEPPNKLDSQERQAIINVANCPEYRDMSPNQIVPKLADSGIYLASESTFYRILKEQQMVNHRLDSKPSTKRYRPEEKVASGPCQVWSWDITYLRSPVKGSFYYLYMFIDVWSRKIMAAQVFDEESMELSAELFTRTCFVHGVQPEGLILHSDNGGPMKGSTMLATLQQLGVVPSFSRPKVSDDNPYSESLFRTMKYRPDYPGKAFKSLEQAQSWADDFVCWYNTVHLHSSISFTAPDDRHYGRDVNILHKRQDVYEQARQKNPERWSRSTRNWDQVEIVRLNPESENSAGQQQQVKEAV